MSLRFVKFSEDDIHHFCEQQNIVCLFIISMTELLDADWLRGVHSVISLIAVQLYIYMFFQNKQNGGQAEFKHKRNCSRGNKIALEKYKQSPKCLLKVWQEWNNYDVYVGNYRLQELDKALQSFTLRLVDEFCHVNSKQVIMRCCSYNLGLIVRVMFANFAIVLANDVRLPTQMLLQAY